ncbi:MAG: efflux RND transporter periplasmic adaptor subunit [Myxococcota bacterium]
MRLHHGARRRQIASGLIVSLGVVWAAACGAEPLGGSDAHVDGADERVATTVDGTASIRLSQAQRSEFGIELQTAGPGHIALTIELPGEIRPDQDRLAHLVPRFGGIVKEVRKQVGDTVQAGDVLAWIESSESLASYPLKSLIDGTVIAKHLTRGEAVATDREAFVVADLRSVWVDLSVYQKDLDRVRVGQQVQIATGHAAPGAEGTLSYVSPVVDEKTRTATARVVLPNPDGTWRPGLFVTGTVTVQSADVPVAIPRDAVQSLGDERVVFVANGDGLEPRPVRLGTSDGRQVEILEGLSPGDRFVSRGGFTLKSELEKAGFEDD